MTFAPHEDKTGEYTFAGFDIAQTVAPDVNTVVVEACMRHAATRFGQAFFGKYAGQDEGGAAGEVHEPNRWPGIQRALHGPEAQVILVSCFAEASVRERLCSTYCLRPHPEIPCVFECDGLPSFRQDAEFAMATIVDGEGLRPRLPVELHSTETSEKPSLSMCFLSSASVVASQALLVAPGEKVLDLCAGPGAKALVLASMLLGTQNGSSTPTLLERVGEEVGDAMKTPSDRGLLVCNEPHRARRAALDSILSSFLPRSLLGEGGSVVQTKAEASSKVPPVLKKYAPFDKVLVDPPCSAARAKAKSRMNANDAYSSALKDSAAMIEELLLCAAALVRAGGLIVYTTTSLEHEENDEAIRKFLRRTNGEFKVEAGKDDSPVTGAESTPFGTLILPDQGTLHGPLYLAQLRRQQ
mmetsp:Transcript_25307/g.58978  ORF Transcript_25307/g.58978 Transcript_25307/m.58978 type:complete len:412 (+) Transcript_25307:63-1298(+)